LLKKGKTRLFGLKKAVDKNCDIFCRMPQKFFSIYQQK
jgi:hypothetical protein